MKLLIESLKRLYRDRKTTKERIRQLHKTGTITQEETDYILEE